MDKVRSYKAREYALYKGENYLGEGTIRQLSERFGYTIKTLQWYNCIAAKRRFEKTSKNNHVFLISLNDDE